METILSHPIVLIIIVLVVLLILMYNNLNSKKQRVESSWAQIDVRLQQRQTMIQTLLDSAVLVLDKESDMQKQVAALRTGIQNYNSSSINEKIGVNNMISRFMVTAEQYPQIASIDLFKEASINMVKEEREIGNARKQYNKNATSYNIQITSFPTSLVAGIFGFNEKFELFELSEDDRKRMTTGEDLRTGALANAKREYSEKANTQSNDDNNQN